MAWVERHVVAVTTNAGGGATAYTPVLRGRLSRIDYTKTDFADGVDFTITGEDSGQTIWSENNVNASKSVAPRQPTHLTDGTGATYDGTQPVRDAILLAGERIKIVVASGGDSKKGTFAVTIEGASS